MNDTNRRPVRLSKAIARRRCPRRRTADRRTSPLWHDLVRGAAYTAGGTLVTLLTAWIQTWH